MGAVCSTDLLGENRRPLKLDALPRRMLVKGIGHYAEQTLLHQHDFIIIQTLDDACRSRYFSIEAINWSSSPLIQEWPSLELALSFDRATRLKLIEWTDFDPGFLCSMLFEFIDVVTCPMQSLSRSQQFAESVWNLAHKCSHFSYPPQSQHEHETVTALADFLADTSQAPDALPETPHVRTPVSETASVSDLEPAEVHLMHPASDEHHHKDEFIADHEQTPADDHCSGFTSDLEEASPTFEYTLIEGKMDSWMLIEDTFDDSFHQCMQVS
jgi:hypothetical protein